MQGGEHHHDLGMEFPEFRERIHELKIGDAKFSRLYEQYQQLDKEIYRIEHEIEAASDEHTENLKKQRVLLKDQLYVMLRS